MTDIDSRIEQIMESRKARDAELMRLMDEPDELTTIVLRSHLAVEELLFTAIASHCADVKYLKEANLRFAQKAAMMRALDKLPSVPPKFWDGIAALNRLRNSLAHTLEPKDVSARIASFIGALKVPGELPKADSESGELKQAIHYLLGGLAVGTAFQDALEELIRHRFSTDGAETN